MDGQLCGFAPRGQIDDVGEDEAFGPTCGMPASVGDRCVAHAGLRCVECGGGSDGWCGRCIAAKRFVVNNRAELTTQLQVLQGVAKDLAATQQQLRTVRDGLSD